jgi:hypothetical protein
MMPMKKKEYRFKCLYDEQDKRTFSETEIKEKGCPWCGSSMKRELNIADSRIMEKIEKTQSAMKPDNVWYLCTNLKCGRILTRI